MATYKKHSKENKKSSTQKVEQRSSTAKFFAQLDYGARSFEDWVARNQKAVFAVIGIVIVAVLGYLAYENFIIAPRQKEAIKEMSQPLSYFNQAVQMDQGSQKDTLLVKSLNGAGGYGLLDIIDNYGGTDAANIAHYAAGMAYLNLGQNKKAVHQLEKFSSDDEIYTVLSKGAIGDAFSDNDQPEEALNYYKQAANARDNAFTTPKYLLKAAMVAVELKKTDEAQRLLNRIKDKYPESSEAKKVPAYLGMAKN